MRPATPIARMGHPTNCCCGPRWSGRGFEAAALGLAAHHTQRSRERAEHEVTLLAALVPLLDQTQLATLEQWLVEPPQGPMRRPPA